jgi:hypothetical protein
VDAGTHRGGCPASILDVCAGWGTYARLLRSELPAAVLTVLEVQSPYIAHFGLAALYDKLIIGDVCKIEPLPLASLRCYDDKEMGGLSPPSGTAAPRGAPVDGRELALRYVQDFLLAMEPPRATRVQIISPSGDQQRIIHT